VKKKRGNARPGLARYIQWSCAIVAVIGVSLSSAAQAGDDNLTWHGITLYGNYDIGVTYLRSGADVSPQSPSGLNYFINKISHKPLVSIAPNGLSQSAIGLRGKEKIADDFNFIFDINTGFSPQSLRLTDSLQSFAYNNGRQRNQQHSAGDSSRAGQLFNGQAYVGISSDTYGTLKLGRNNFPARDAMSNYDPLNGSYAFSVLSYSNAGAAIGAVDNSIKYAYKYGNFRISGLYQPGFSTGSPGVAKEIDVGFDYGRLSMDVAAGKKNTAIAANSLTAKQLATGVPYDSLSATISDNSTYLIMASYKLDGWKLDAGLLDIRYENPSRLLHPMLEGLGGHWFSFVNNSAFPHTKVLNIYWIGFDHPLTAKLDLAAGWYFYDQNAYGKKKCSDTSSSSCSGTQNMPAVRFDYRINHYFDTYAGIMYSKVNGGLASGFLHTWNIDPTVGVRLRF
jgi:predicted porin